MRYFRFEDSFGTRRVFERISVAICLLFGAFIGFVNSSLVVLPSDTFATVGSDTQMNCSTDLSVPIHWQHIPDGSLYPTDVYLNNIIVNRYVGRFQVNTDRVNGVYNLVISDAQLEDSGIFRCLDNQGTGDQREAKLKVTESTELQLTPGRAEVQVGNTFQFTCKTYYKDKEIRWQRIPTGNRLPDDVYIVGQLVNGYGVRYEVQKENGTGLNKLIIRNAELKDSGIFRCIDGGGPGQQKDAYLTVVEPPQCHSSVNASCEIIKAMENVTLTCSVNYSGNSTPAIEWRQNSERKGRGNVESLSGNVKSILEIETKEASSESYLLPYTCVSVASNASCNITIQLNCPDESTKAADAGPAKEDEENHNPVYIPIIVTLIIIIIIVVIIVGVIIYFREKRAKQKNNQNNNENVDVALNPEGSPNPD